MQIIETTNVKEGDNILLNFSTGQVIAEIDYVNRKANTYRAKINKNSYYIGTFKSWRNIGRDVKVNLPTLFKVIKHEM